MPQNLSYLLLAVILAAAVVACGKSKSPANESENAPEAGQTNQAVVLVSASAVVTTVQSEPESEEALSIADGLALAQKNNCLACHTIDKKMVGPAWKDVAKRYKGVAGIEHKLVIKVSTGGDGNWGNMPMPAMAPTVKEKDIRTLVKFVLSLDN